MARAWGYLEKSSGKQRNTPRTSAEAESIQTDTFTPPEFVREIKLNVEHEEYQVAIEVYFKEGAIPGAVYDGHFVYVAGNPSSVAGSMVEWTCGAEGIEPQFLPSRCQQQVQGAE